MDFDHTTVLREEVVEHLNASTGGTFVDGTLGGGGHTEAILQASLTSKVCGIDRDKRALDAARQRLAPYADRVQFLQGNFADMDTLLDRINQDLVSGVVLDLGVSSPQLDRAERGFSYQLEAPLDMRMDESQGLTAAEFVNTASKERLTSILRDYGEERWADRIASFIIRERATRNIKSTGELVEVVKAAIPAAARRSGPHPARRTFQALRIAVNDELGNLERGLGKAVEALAPGGRLAVITFHSLEDRIVKRFYKQEENPCECPPRLPVCQCGKRPRLKVVTPKGVTPSPNEVERNSRSRSARLRVAERVL